MSLSIMKLKNRQRKFLNYGGREKAFHMIIIAEYRSADFIHKDSRRVSLM